MTAALSSPVTPAFARAVAARKLAEAASAVRAYDAMLPKPPPLHPDEADHLWRILIAGECEMAAKSMRGMEGEE